MKRRRPTAAPFFFSRASRCVVSWLCRKLLFRPQTWQTQAFLSLLTFAYYVQLLCVKHICLGSCSKATCRLPPCAFRARTIAKVFFAVHRDLWRAETNKNNSLFLFCSCAFLSVCVVYGCMFWPLTADPGETKGRPDLEVEGGSATLARLRFQN